MGRIVHSEQRMGCRCDETRLTEKTYHCLLMRMHYIIDYGRIAQLAHFTFQCHALINMLPDLELRGREENSSKSVLCDAAVDDRRMKRACSPRPSALGKVFTMMSATCHQCRPQDCVCRVSQ